MTTVATRGSRGVVLFGLLLATTVGLLLLTATWTPRWGVDVLAGTRVVVTPADPEASDADLDATARELEARAREAGAPGATVRRGSDGAFLVALPGRPEERVLDALRSNDQVAVRGVAATGLSLPTLPPLPSDEPAPPAVQDLPTPEGDALEWTVEPEGVWLDSLALLRCEDPATAEALAGQSPDPLRPLLACDPTGMPLLLGPALITGTDVDGAVPALDSGTWSVRIALDSDATGTIDDAVEELLPLAEERVAAADPELDPDLDPDLDPELDPEAPAAPDALAGDAPAGSADELDSGTGAGTGEDDAPGDEDETELEEPALRVLAVTLDADLAAVGDADVDGDVLAVADRTLDQRSSDGVATRVRAGALPAAVGSVEVVRLGSTLDRDEGTHAALAALVGLLLAVGAAFALARRRALLPLTAVVGTGALAAPGLLVADQVVGLALSLPVAVATLGALGVAPLLAVGILVVQERELPDRTPGAAASRAGAEVWRRWWPPVAAGVLGAGLVRLSAGDLVGDVAVAVGTVLLAALVAGATLVRSTAVLLAGSSETAEPGPAPTTSATTSATTAPEGAAARRPTPFVLAALALVGAVAVAGLLVRGVASDPAFTAGEEHLVTVTGDPVNARGAVRDAVRSSGVVLSSLRDAGEDTVLLTTPTLTSTERGTLVTALRSVDEVQGPITSGGFDAAGSTRAWQIGAGLLAVALVGGVLLGRRLIAAPARLVPVVLGATVIDVLLGLGLAAWLGLTWSPATLAALGVVAVVGVTTHLAVVADRAPGVRLAPRYVAGSLLHLAPIAGIVVAAPSARGPFALVLVGLAVALTSALCLTGVVGGTPAPRPREEAEAEDRAVPPVPDREVPVP